MNWNKNDSRFVAFFDILGFKDLVMRNDHNTVLAKLETLKSTAEFLEKATLEKEYAERNKIGFDNDQTKVITFSDSIIIFSKTGGKQDLLKIIIDCYYILTESLKNKIAIKGAISFGEVTVDFEKSLFFGKPIIDAYLLHEDLHMLDVILDHNAENRIAELGDIGVIANSLHREKLKMKFGLSTHTVLRSHYKEKIEERIKALNALYTVTSGKPRLYIDNSIDYYKNVTPFQ